MNERKHDLSEARYRAVALQLRCRAVNGLDTPAAAREQILKSVNHVARAVRATVAFWGPQTRLVVLPEYFLTGFPMRESAAAWIAKACITMSGPEVEALGACAEANNVYLACNAYETDERFPGHFFQTSFVLDPSGAVVLRYRRLNSMYATTPHDVWDAYLDRYGLDAVFPVATTAIGRLAAVASEEILYPEIARAMALRGAEVLLHSSSEIHAPTPTAKDVAKLARASENMAYVVSANSAGLEGTAVPAGSVDGGSRVVDHRGLILGSTGPGESMTASGEIDLEAVRAARRRPGLFNVLSRQRIEVCRAAYEDIQVYPPNTRIDAAPSRANANATQRETIARLVEQGRL